MHTPYTSPQEFTASYLRLLALRLQREVALLRAVRGGRVNEAFLGLFLSDEELDAALDGLHGLTAPGNGHTVALEAAIAAQAEQVAARRSAAQGSLPVDRLAELFALSPAAVDLILLLLAPEVDDRFSRVYAFLQDDVSRRWLTPSLAWRLLGLPADSSAARELLRPDGPLLAYELLHLTPAENGVPLPLIQRPLKLDDRIVAFLLDHDSLDPRVLDWATLVPEDSGWDLQGFEPVVQAQLRYLLDIWRNGASPPAFFWGPEGGGKGAAARYLAAELRRPLLVIKGERLPPSQESLLRAWRLVEREARLSGALVYLRGYERMEPNNQPSLWDLLGAGVIVSAAASQPSYPADHSPLELHFPVPGHALRLAWWKVGLNGSLPPGVADELANRFQLTPGQIQQAARTARRLASLRRGPDAEPDSSDLYEGARRQSNPALSRLATKIVSPHTWEDLVLPAPQLGQLRAIASQVRHAHTVYESWDFGQKLAYGRGLAALFSGPSGTGKTMAVGILAHALGLDLYKIDLSGVVSKYIGETEKNLDRIFNEAATANAILFFDEADALFGKRSEVKDAHDRYANIEISYLLQKMESYDGVAVLATNLSQNLDEAFTRRLQFIVEFPFPSVTHRERIWRGLFPAAAPTSPDIDFAFLADQFELTGGNIKNCVLAAAFAAAEAGEPIGMVHLVQAVAREMGKLGQPLQRAAFADYFAIARNGRR